MFQGEVFQEFLQHTFLHQQNLATEYIDAYMNSLRTESIQGFQVFVKVCFVALLQLLSSTIHTLLYK